MKKEMKKVPTIRFRGFTDDWEQRKLGEIAKFINGRAYAQDELLTNGKYKVLRVGNFYTNDSWYYSNLELEDKYYANNGDLLYTWSATFGPHIWHGDKVIYHYHIWKIDLSDELEKQFTLQLLEQDKSNILSGHNGSTMAHITKNGMEEKMVSIPKSIVEQKQIGLFFKNIDNLITLHQRKSDQLKKLKAYFLQNLFPAKGEKVPKIRFKGFTGDWEQRKLLNCFDRFIVPMRDKPKKFGGNVPWTRIEDIEGKYLNGSLSERYVSEETISKMNLKIIPKDSLIVSSSATFGVVAIVTQDLITNQTFIGLVPKDKKELDYWYIYFQSNEARNYMRLESAGSTIFYISRESFEKMPVMVPSKDEMLKIGKIFSNLDSIITLHQRKLDALQTLKKYLLQNLFI